MEDEPRSWASFVTMKLKMETMKDECVPNAAPSGTVDDRSVQVIADVRSR